MRVLVCVFFLCIYVHVSVYVCYSNVAQAWKVFAHIFPWRAQSYMARDTGTERHNDCLVKRLTAPQADFVMQFSVEG